MKKTNCIVCSKDSPNILLENRKDPFLKNIGLSRVVFVMCSGCGFVYQSPKLESQEISKLYLEDYYDENDKPISNAYALKKEGYAQSSFDQVSTKIDLSSCKNKNILDIGSNTGSFLNLFKSVGWYTVGVEASRKMADEAQNRYSLDEVHQCLFDANFFTDRKFGLVSLLHTLEHIENPSVILENIYNVLDDDGMLYIEVPDVFHPKSCFYISFYSSPHLYVFSHSSLTNLLSNNRFEVVYSGIVPRGLYVLAKKKSTKDLNKYKIDDIEKIRKITLEYKKRHDRHAFIYRFIANSLLSRILIKLHIPVLSKLLFSFRERVRVNRPV
ncbi:hypothetical protein C0581_02990 [Candidatus Parcubacteria bacterium]|nr:MAG: hypothetical protein C0581_02990 [Candidatus Parcubacteria bacterium]